VKRRTYRPRSAVSSIIIPKDAGGQSQNYQNHPWTLRNRILLFPYPFNPDSMYCPQKRNNNPYSVHELLVEVSCCTLKLPRRQMISKRCQKRAICILSSRVILLHALLTIARRRRHLLLHPVKVSWFRIVPLHAHRSPRNLYWWSLALNSFICAPGWSWRIECVVWHDWRRKGTGARTTNCCGMYRCGVRVYAAGIGIRRSPPWKVVVLNAESLTRVWL
jgi:hypothetical protein